MIQNKVYTREEMREEHIITSDYKFIDKEGEYFAKLIMRAEASRNMMRLFSSAKWRKKNNHTCILVAELSWLLRDR